MDEDRFVISDRFWNRPEPLLPGKKTDSGVTARDHRLFPEAVFWRVRTGSPWRDLPERFGNWNSQFRRFRRWAERGVFESFFNILSDTPDLEYAMIDGTIVSVHQKATGAKGGSGSGDRTLTRRVGHKNCGSGRCPRQPCALCYFCLDKHMI